MDALERYVRELSTPQGEVLAWVERQSWLRTSHGRQVSGPEVGALLRQFVQLLQPRRVLEIGTFSGYSALCLAEGLADDDCYVNTIEINDEQEDFIREHLAASPYGKRVRLHIGDARDIVPALGERYDLVFIDANKRQYVEYYDLAMDHLNDGGYIIADNTLWAGKVVDPKAQHEAQTQGVLAFNEYVKNDSRVEQVIIPLRDGLTLIHRL